MFIVVIGLIMVTIGLAVGEADRVKKDSKPWMGLIKFCVGLALALWLPSVAYFTLSRSDVPLGDFVLWMILYPGTFLTGLGMLLMIYGKTHVE